METAEDFFVAAMAMVVLIGIIVLIGAAGASVGRADIAEQWCISLGHDTGAWIDDALRCVTYTMGE